MIFYVVLAPMTSIKNDYIEISLMVSCTYEGDILRLIHNQLKVPHGNFDHSSVRYFICFKRQQHTSVNCRNSTVILSPYSLSNKRVFALSAHVLHVICLVLVAYGSPYGDKHILI